MAEPIPEDVQRWTSRRRVALVPSILKGETSVSEAARRVSRRARDPLGHVSLRATRMGIPKAEFT